MKWYKKDGQILAKNQIVIYNDDTQTINPSEELILADGWEEMVMQTEYTINDYKRDKKQEIIYFDSSPEVNEFTIQGLSVWLDKATRAGLMLRFQAEEAVGKENTTLWYGNHQFELTISNAMQMLYFIENYASACYDNTQRHLANIEKLETVEEIKSYDYTTGYPEKLVF